MRPYIISVSNQKGGVGKTTTSFQVSIYLAGTGRKTLLIDTDPQGNLTKSLIDSDEPGVYEALILQAFFFFGPPGGEFPAKSRSLVTYRVGRAHVDIPISLSPGSASAVRPHHMRTTLLLLLRFDFFLTEGCWGRMVWDILNLIFEIFCQPCHCCGLADSGNTAQRAVFF